MAEEVKEEVKEYKLAVVPTGEALAIQTPEGEALSTEQVLVVLLNKINNLEKKL